MVEPDGGHRPGRIRGEQAPGDDARTSGPNGYWDVDSDVVLAQTKGNVENEIRYVRHDLWPGALHRQRCSERPGAGLVRHSDQCPDTEDNVQGILTSTYPSGWKTSSGTTTSQEPARRFAWNWDSDRSLSHLTMAMTLACSQRMLGGGLKFRANWPTTRPSRSRSSQRPDPARTCRGSPGERAAMAP